MNRENSTKIGVIGLGNMGCATANLIASNGYDVIAWEYNKDVVSEVNEKHENKRFLPDIKLSERLRATSNINELFENCKIIFIAIHTRFIRATLSRVKSLVSDDVVFVNLAKGIEPETGLTTCQLLKELFPENKIIMLSGASIANEFSRGMATVVVLAGEDRETLLKISRLLDNDYFRTRFSDDITGVELGGILKNIYAVGLGIFDGKGIKSINFRSAYLTIALEEMTRLGVALGAKKETFFYFSGLADLIATSMSEHSHNRTLGELLAKGYKLEEIEKKMGVIPEGYNTLKYMLYIAEKHHVSLPLAKNLWEVMNARESVDRFIRTFIRDFLEES